MGFAICRLPCSQQFAGPIYQNQTNIPNNTHNFFCANAGKDLSYWSNLAS